MHEISVRLEKLFNSRRFNAVFLSVCCTITLLYRGRGLFPKLLNGPPDIQHISYDGVYYAQIARNLLAGDGPGWEALIFPILQPLLVALMSWWTGITNFPLLAQYLNTLAGTLALIPVYFIAREVFGKTAAVFAVLLTMTYPQLVAISMSDTTESLYSLLVMTSIWAALIAMRAVSYRRAAVAGALLGLTYLARPEGLIVFFTFLPILFWRVRKLADTKKAFAATATVMVVFSVLAAPYVAFLWKGYGKPILSCKLPYESIKMKEAVMGEKLKTADVYGITESGKLAWQEYGGAGVVFGYIKSAPKKFFSSYASNLMSQMPWSLRGNSSHMAGYPRTYPLYFWLPALAGFIALMLDRSKTHMLLALSMPYMNMFVYPVFTAGFWLYHTPYLPIVVILATGGVSKVAEKVQLNPRSIIVMLTTFSVAWWAFSVNAVVYSKPMKVGRIQIRTIVSEESQEIGRQMRKFLGTDVTYMAAWSRMVFFLGGRWVEMPSGNEQELISYARHHDVDYIVEELKNVPPNTNFRFVSTPGLVLVYTYTSKKVPYRIAIWRLMEEGTYHTMY